MKITTLLVLAALPLVAISCATPKYKTYSTAGDFKAAAKKVVGKTPKEAVAIMGKPMSAYYAPDKSVYYVVYPENSTEVSMMDVMMNDRLECLTMNFEKEKDYKFDGWQSDVAGTCAAIKGQTLDTSLID